MRDAGPFRLRRFSEPVVGDCECDGGCDDQIELHRVDGAVRHGEAAARRERRRALAHVHALERPPVRARRGVLGAAWAGERAPFGAGCTLRC